MTTQQQFDYEELKRIKEAEKLAKEQKSGSIVDFTPIEWCALKSGFWKTFKIAGVPFELRKENWHAKQLLQSSILKDDGTGYIKVNWRTIYNKGKYEIDPDWILSKLYNKVFKTGKWVKYEEKDVDGVNVIKKEDGKIVNTKGHNAYFVATYKNTKSYVRIAANQKEGSKMKHSFYPKNRVLIQGIDLTDDWCYKNKHFKLLSSNDYAFEIKTPEGTTEQRHMYDTGIPMVLYNLIWEDILDLRKSWDFGIGIFKTGTTNSPYKVKDCKADPLPSELDAMFKLVLDKTSGMTEEELSFEKYDLDTLFAESTYQKMYNNLIGLFRQADLDTGSNFSEELIKLVEQEKKDMETKGNVNSQAVEPDEPIIDKLMETTNITQQPEAPKRAERAQNVDIKTLLSTTFKHWNDLDEADRQDILNAAVGLSPDNEKIFYKENTLVAACDNVNCGILLPNTVMSCPKCGTKFQVNPVK